MLIQHTCPASTHVDPVTPAAQLTRLRDDVTRCAVPRDHRTQLRANRRIQAWIADTLADLGLDVRLSPRRSPDPAPAAQAPVVANPCHPGWR